MIRNLLSHPHPHTHCPFMLSFLYYRRLSPFCFVLLLIPDVCAVVVLVTPLVMPVVVTWQC
jgi:hypothetical protein